MSRPAQDRPPRIRRAPRHRPDARYAIRAPERLESRRLLNFGPPTVFSVGGVDGTPVSIAAGDFNGDGKPDLVTRDIGTLDGRDDGVSVLLNDGHGGFPNTVNIDTGQPLTFSIFTEFAPTIDNEVFQDAVAVGKFDGRDDSVVAADDGGITVLLGHGDGTFARPLTIPLGGRTPQGVAVGDIDGDGKLDIVTADPDGGDIAVVRGDGDGTFEAPVYVKVGGPGFTPTDVAFGDFFGSGRPEDLVVASPSDTGPGIITLSGFGGCRFAREYDAPVVASGYTTLVRVADLNGDGNSDVVASGYSSAEYLNNYGDQVLLGDGAGSFLPEVQYLSTEVGESDPHVAIGDFNGDGKLDVVTAGPYSAALYEADCHGQFRYVRGDSINDIGPGRSGLLGVTAFDDGPYSDMAAAYSVSGQGVEVAYGSVDPATLTSGIAAGVPERPLAAAVGDFNGDGNPDIVTANYADSTVSLALGKGDGTFRPASRYVDGAIGTIAYYTPEAVADFNHDGRSDLATFNAIDDTVRVLLGEADGTLVPPAWQAVYQVPPGWVGQVAADMFGNIDLAAADIDGDGKTDLIVSGDKGDLIILPGNGDGTFRQPYLLDTNAGAADPDTTFINSLAVGDFDGDGTPDVAVGYHDGTVRVLLLGVTSGSISISSSDTYRTVDSGDPWLVAGDFSGGGRPDLAAANPNENTVSVLKNTGDPHDPFGVPPSDPSLTPFASYDAGTTGGDSIMVTADLNGDGLPDLVTTNADNTVSILIDDPRDPGTFAPDPSSPLTPPGTVWTYPALGDVTGDGHPDLVLADSSLYSSLVDVFPNEWLWPTVTSVASSDATSVVGQVVDFTASAGFSVRGDHGEVTLQEVDSTGRVVATLGTVPLPATGVATFPVSSLAAGTHLIRAVYDVEEDDARYTSVTITQVVNTLTPGNIQAAIQSSSPAAPVAIAAPSGDSLVDILGAIASLPSSTTGMVMVTLSGTTYQDQDGGGNVVPFMASAPPGVTLTISCPSGGATVYDLRPTGGNVDVHGSSDGTITLVGMSPALTVTTGHVTIGPGVILTTATASPTILVTGGTLTIRGAVIQESTGSDQAAIQVTGGAVDLGTAADPGGNVINVNGSGDLVRNTSGNPVSAIGDAFTIDGVPLAPSSVSGLVFSDFNDDGQVDFGEAGIAGVTINLEGTDFLGSAVHATLTTDADGTYVFLGLLPGRYAITEAQPAGYTQGTDSVGTGGGTASLDRFDLQLSAALDALNYNYGERPAATGAVRRGQTAGIGFWNNKNGQALILALNGGVGTRLGDWLAATFPHMFGASSGGNSLAGKGNGFVAALFQKDFVVHGVKLDAQVLATALAVYVSDAVLDSTGVGSQYGFTVGGNGVATSTFSVGSNGAAFGVADYTTMTVMDLLLAVDAQSVNGVLYGGDTARRNKANSVFGAINDVGGI